MASRLVPVKELFNGKVPEKYKDYINGIVDKVVYVKTGDIGASWVADVHLAPYQGRDDFIHIGSGENHYGTFSYNGQKRSLYSSILDIFSLALEIL